MLRSDRVRRGVLIASVAALAAVSACSSSGSPGTRPAGLPAWYDVPPSAAAHPGSPGTLIKSQKVGAVPGLHATVYRVMYASESAQKTPSVVTGLVYVPLVPPPPGGYPVVSWGHGTNGMAPQCAPSLTPTSLSSDIDAFRNTLLDKGWEMVASDYQGEGTTGPLPYLVGSLAAQNTIDIVRAARHLDAAHASVNYAVWGHSEGGQTAVFADQMSGYAPELHMVGVVAGAPPSQFNLIYQFLTTSPYRFYVYMVAVGYHSGYGDQAAPLGPVLTPLGQSLTPVVANGCFDYLQKTLDAYSLAQLLKGDPTSVPAWKALLAENDPGQASGASPVPLLIVQGGSDEQIPVASTALLAQHLCGLGQPVQRWIYPGQNHDSVIQYYVPDMLRWLSARFAGQPVSGITPSGEPGAQITPCQA